MPKQIGIVGLGKFGKVHLKELGKYVETGQVEIPALCDKYPKRYEEIRNNPGFNFLGRDFNFYTSVEKMYDEERLDAVHDVTNMEEHFKTTMGALQRGISTFTEKPLATSYMQALALLGEAWKSKSKMAVGYVVRTSEAVQTVRNALDNYKFNNKVHLFPKDIYYDGLYPSFLEAGWFNAAKSAPFVAKNIIDDELTHPIDLLLHFLYPRRFAYDSEAIFSTNIHSQEGKNLDVESSLRIRSFNAKFHGSYIIPEQNRRIFLVLNSYEENTPRIGIEIQFSKKYANGRKYDEVGIFDYKTKKWKTQKFGTFSVSKELDLWLSYLKTGECPIELCNREEAAINALALESMKKAALGIEYKEHIPYPLEVDEDVKKFLLNSLIKK